MNLKCRLLSVTPSFVKLGSAETTVPHGAVIVCMIV